MPVGAFSTRGYEPRHLSRFERRTADLVMDDVVVGGRVVPRAERVGQLCEAHAPMLIEPFDSVKVQCLDRPEWGVLTLSAAAERVGADSRPAMLMAIDAARFVSGLKFVREGRTWRGPDSVRAERAALFGVKVVRVDPRTGLDVGEPFESYAAAAEYVGRAANAIKTAVKDGTTSAGWRWRVASDRRRFRGGKPRGRPAVPFVLLSGLRPVRWFPSAEAVCRFLHPDYDQCDYERRRQMRAALGRAARDGDRYHGRYFRRAKPGEEAAQGYFDGPGLRRPAPALSHAARRKEGGA